MQMLRLQQIVTDDEDITLGDATCIINVLCR